MDPDTEEAACGEGRGSDTADPTECGRREIDVHVGSSGTWTHCESTVYPPPINLTLSPGSTQVRGHASALLAVAGRSLGLHRLLLCGGLLPSTAFISDLPCARRIERPLHNTTASYSATTTELA
jgi:hypothetical protein